MRPGGSSRVFRHYSGWGTRGPIAQERGRGLQAHQNQPRARTPARVPPASRQGRQATPGGLGPPTKARALRGWCQERPIWAARHVGSTFRARAKIVPRWYRHGPYKSCSETDGYGAAVVGRKTALWASPASQKTAPPIAQQNGAAGSAWWRHYIVEILKKTVNC